MALTLQQLADAGLQYGYSRTRRHPSTKSFVHSNKGGIDFINLDKTKVQLEEALSFLYSIKNAGKMILFVGVKPEVRQLVKETALSLNAPYVAERFIGGTLTNFVQMKKRVDRLHDLLKKKENGEFSVFTKKEQLLLQREIERLDKDFGGVSTMNNLPAAIVMIDPRFEAMCVLEAKRMNIPVVALSSTDCNINTISYPVVGNDGSLLPVKFFLEMVKTELQK